MIHRQCLLYLVLSTLLSVGALEAYALDSGYGSPQAVTDLDGNFASLPIRNDVELAPATEPPTVALLASHTITGTVAPLFQICRDSLLPPARGPPLESRLG